MGRGKARGPMREGRMEGAKGRNEEGCKRCMGVRALQKISGRAKAGIDGRKEGMSKKWRQRETRVEEAGKERERLENSRRGLESG